jgi:hypothetical protein
LQRAIQAEEAGEKLDDQADEASFEIISEGPQNLFQSDFEHLSQFDPEDEFLQSE